MTKVPWHPVPTRLVDEVMPALKDTELRVLLVVLRQTWGWQADRLAERRTGTGTSGGTGSRTGSCAGGRGGAATRSRAR